MDKYVSVKNLNKHYWKSHILKNLTFSLNKWECLWFIWHNWAGKTTTIKILNWVNEPDKWSEIYINNMSIKDFKNENKVSYLPEKVNFQEYLTGMEFIKYIISLNELEWKISQKDIDIALEKSKFPMNAINNKIKTYSKGMQQRLWLASILVNPNNELIILDEPVSWLDPVGQEEMIEIILSLKEDWKTIFLTTHQMIEVERLCDNIIFLEKWEIKDYTTVNEAMKEYWNLTEYYKQLSWKKSIDTQMNNQ